MTETNETRLRDELLNIANAQRFNRKDFSDDSEFASWAQSRARWTLELVYPGILSAGCLLLLLSTAPALADAWDPTRPIPQPSLRALQASGRGLADGLGPQGTRVDAEGTRYSPEDVALGFLPVIPGYRRSGGGLVRVWNGAPTGVLVAGLNSPATVTLLMQERPPSVLPPDPPSPPDPPDDHHKPDPPQPPVADVPGPLPFLALVVAFFFTRKLRKRHSS